MDIVAHAKMDDEIENLVPVGGPKTERGKEIARWNATRHGIRSPVPVVPGVEKSEDWEEHRGGVLDNLSPVGHLEFVLAERVALLSWRLHRVTRYETESAALAQEKIEDDIHERRRLLNSLRGGSLMDSTHPEDVRFEAIHARKTHIALKRFSSYAAGKTLKAQDATSVVWGVLIQAKRESEEDIDTDSLELPGVPEDAWIEELPAMKVEDVRGCVEAIAAHAGADPDELLAAATEHARLDSISTKYRAQEVEGEIGVMRRERLLPDERTLEKICRYEAHLARQFFKALHELEALQIRRSGGSAPLARLDVDGSFAVER